MCAMVKSWYPRNHRIFLKKHQPHNTIRRLVGLAALSQLLQFYEQTTSRQSPKIPEDFTAYAGYYNSDHANYES